MLRRDLLKLTCGSLFLPLSRAFGSVKPKNQNQTIIDILDSLHNKNLGNTIDLNISNNGYCIGGEPDINGMSYGTICQNNININLNKLLEVLRDLNQPGCFIEWEIKDDILRIKLKNCNRVGLINRLKTAIHNREI